jgi:hypothetical protein
MQTRVPSKPKWIPPRLTTHSFSPRTQVFRHFADRDPIIGFKSKIGKNVASKNARSTGLNRIVKIFFLIGLCPHFSATHLQPLPPSRN